MLSGIEKIMYDVQDKNVKVILDNASVFDGYCIEFTSDYDNDPDPSSLTVRIRDNGEINGVYFAKDQLIELFSTEIKEVIVTDK